MIRWSVGTFARLIGSAFAFSQINPLRDYTSNIKRAYQDFCESLVFAAKQCIPCGRRKNYVPCWDKECETLYRSFTRAPVGTASDSTASSLPSRLGQKKHDQLEEAVNSIDFSHYSRKTWKTINKLTGRSGCSFYQCPISAKLHRLATREERGTHDRGLQVYQAGQQGAVRPMEDPNTWGSKYLWAL